MTTSIAQTTRYIAVRLLLLLAIIVTIFVLKASHQATNDDSGGMIRWDIVNPWLTAIAIWWLFGLTVTAKKADYLRGSLMTFTAVSIVLFIVGLGAAGKAALDMPSAGNPCSYAAEYPTCFPAHETVTNNLHGGLWMILIFGLLSAPGVLTMWLSPTMHAYMTNQGMLTPKSTH